MVPERAFKKIVADSKAKTAQKTHQPKHLVSMNDIQEKGIVGALCWTDESQKEFPGVFKKTVRRLSDLVGTYEAEYQLVARLEDKVLAKFANGPQKVDTNFIFAYLNFARKDIVTAHLEDRKHLQYARENQLTPDAFDRTSASPTMERLKTGDATLACIQDLQESKAISQPTKEKVISLITTGHLPAGANMKSINKLTNRLEAKQIKSLHRPQQLAALRAMNDLDSILAVYEVHGMSDQLVQLITHRENADVINVVIARQINQDLTVNELVALSDNAITRDFFETVAEVRDELAIILNNGQVYEFQAA